MTLVIIAGGIDLSVGPTAAIAAVVAAVLMAAGAPIVVAIPVALLFGVAAGAVNGLLVAYGGLQPFIVTLGTLSLYRATALIYTGGNPIFGIPPSSAPCSILPFSAFPIRSSSSPCWHSWCGCCSTRRRFGEYFLAVGGNAEPSHIAGVPVAMTKIASYVISGGLAAVAGLILVGRLGAADPTLGNLWELDAIAAAAIGGASLMGGKGSDRRHPAGRDHPRQPAQRFDAAQRPGVLPTVRHGPYHSRRHADRSGDKGPGMNISLTDPRTVGPRIRMMMPHLTPLEGRVVDMMLGRRDFDETTSLKTVAEDAGVSEAMIIKITKKLGFEGFRDFRAGIVDYNRLPTADLHQELSPDDTGVEIAQKVFRTSMHALEETLSILDPEAFEKAADLIYNARQRDFYGIGGSAQIARDVATSSCGSGCARVFSTTRT